MNKLDKGRYLYSLGRGEGGGVEDSVYFIYCSLYCLNELLFTIEVFKINVKAAKKKR